MTAADRYADWDAAYVLGALSLQERHEFEAHLQQCPGCTAAVAELAGLPGVLGHLGADTAVAMLDLPREPAGTALADATRSAEAVPLLARRIRRGRTRRRLVTGVGVAAALVLGAGLGTVLPQAFAPAAEAETLTPVAGSGLTAQLALTPVAWGTRLSWSCEYAVPAGATPAPAYRAVQYSLVVTTKSGGTETVATWSSSGAEARNLAAATHVPAGDIRSIDIRVTGTSQPLARARLG